MLISIEIRQFCLKTTKTSYLMKSHSYFIKSDCDIRKVLFWRAKITLYSTVFIAVLFPRPSAFKGRQKDALVQNPGSTFFRELSKALKLASVGIQPGCVCERLKSGETHLSRVGFYKLSGIDLEWNGLAQI